MTKKLKSGQVSKKRGPAVKSAETENTTAAAQNTGEASNMTGKVTIQDNVESALLKLPAEIKQKIWILAIRVDGPIEPMQIRERSNKFIWSKAQIKSDDSSKKSDGSSKKTIEDVAPLTAVSLSRVCRTLYEEVALTHLFYKVNRFVFVCAPAWRVNRATGTVNYLVALTSPRMKAIRSITCDWSGIPKEASKLFTVLATCDGLQELTLLFHSDFHIPYYHFSNSGFQAELSKIPGYKDALIAVEGLQTLNLKVCETCSGVAYANRFKSLVAKLEPVLRERMKDPRGTSPYSLESLLIAQREATLDIHGDGRLSDDKKPSIIASRTRHQLRKLETLTDDGTIPKRVISKYDADGDLAWQVDEILASRRSEPDGFPPSVEFRAKIASLTGIHAWQRSDLPAEISWEDVSVLNALWCRHAIVTFYQKNPQAYGKETVVEAWNLRDHDSGMAAKELKGYRALTSQLLAIIERQLKIDERLAEAAAKKAAKDTAKDAKKDKKKVTKAKKLKTVNF